MARSTKGSLRRPRKPRRQPEPPIALPPGIAVRIVHNEVRAKVHARDADVFEFVHRQIRFRPEGYAHMPRFKSGKWHGYIRLLDGADHTFPAGLTARVAKKLTDRGAVVTVEDRTTPAQGEPLLAGARNSTVLRPYQDDAIARALDRKRGIFEAATGLGKTEIMGELIRLLGCRALILVHKAELAWQTIERFSESLDFPHVSGERLFGIVGDDIDAPGLITAAMYQTLHYRLEQAPEETREWLESFEAVHLDECHRVPAKTWWPIVNACSAFWRFGYSATPFKEDKGHELKLIGATGEVFYSFAAKKAIEEKWLAPPFVFMIRPSFPSIGAVPISYGYDYEKGVVQHEGRNELIADIAKGVSEGLGMPTLILVERIAHGKNLQRALRVRGVDADFLSGSVSTTRDRRAALRAMRAGRIRCLIATTIFDESIDVPAIGALILTGAGRARHRLLQRIGRGLRLSEDKEYLAVFDFWDDHSRDEDERPGVLWKQSAARLRAVKKAGFACEELTAKEALARINAGNLREPSSGVGSA